MGGSGAVAGTSRGAIDPDDVGAHVGELQGAEGQGAEPRQLHHRDARSTVRSWSGTVRPAHRRHQTPHRTQPRGNEMTEARFEGKAALITGAGSGIGRAVTLRLAAEGGDVLAHDLNGDALAETAKLAADAAPTIDDAHRRHQQPRRVHRHRRRRRRPVRRARRARQRRRHRARRALPRGRGARLPPDDGRERRRLLLPRAGGDPAPARDATATS